MILSRIIYAYLSTNFELNVAILTFTMISTFTCFFFIPKEKKTSKSVILEMLPSWYILSLKPKGNVIAKI